MKKEMLVYKLASIKRKTLPDNLAARTDVYLVKQEGDVPSVLIEQTFFANRPAPENAGAVEVIRRLKNATLLKRSVHLRYETLCDIFASIEKIVDENEGLNN